MKMKRFLQMVLLVSLVSTSTACGGGGGGSDSNSFAGTYVVRLIKIIDSCNGGFPNTQSVTHTVNQDGDRIVLDSGMAVLEGEVNEDGDGFSVSTSRPTDCSLAGGGAVATAVSYAPSDDADFGVGLAIVSRCGNVSCELGYAGTAEER